MKLIFCRLCHHIFNLCQETKRFCDCGGSWGQYQDDLNATYGGGAIPLGIANSTLADAINNQPDSGWGRNFTAFVVPKHCPTFEKEPENA